jgi:hypothetical protein
VRMHQPESVNSGQHQMLPTSQGNHSIPEKR